MAGLLSAPKPPPLPPVPPPPTAAELAAEKEAAELEAERKAGEALAEELRAGASRRGRASTILAGGYDADQPGALGSRTLLGG